MGSKCYIHNTFQFDSTPGTILYFCVDPLFSAQIILLHEISTLLLTFFSYFLWFLGCLLSLELPSCLTHMLNSYSHSNLSSNSYSSLKLSVVILTSVFIVLGLYLYSPYFIYNNLFTPASHFVVGSQREGVKFYSALFLQH
jgi:hypothetical protein